MVGFQHYSGLRLGDLRPKEFAQINWDFIRLGVPIRVPQDKDYSIIGSESGSPYFGKLPNGWAKPLKRCSDAGWTTYVPEQCVNYGSRVHLASCRTLSINSMALSGHLCLCSRRRMSSPYAISRIGLTGRLQRESHGVSPAVNICSSGF